MAYRVVPDDNVSAEVSTFSAPTLHYWKVSLRQIADDPFPRRGTYKERVVAISPLPVRDRHFEITEETSVSGETMFVFVADFFPGWSIVYVVEDRPVDGYDGEAFIFYLRRYVKGRL